VRKKQLFAVAVLPNAKQQTRDKLIKSKALARPAFYFQGFCLYSIWTVRLEGSDYGIELGLNRGAQRCNESNTNSGDQAHQ
jgi:hypothetical protein